MAERRSFPRPNGFSLVEMLVALVFTLVLMAGMASVFRASLSSFYTSGEAVSNARRNRMSIDLLGDDLNTACMYLVDLSAAPPTSAANPPFYILPNMPIAGAVALPGEPTIADELYFYLDQPLPFEGRLAAVGPQHTASEMANNGSAPTADDLKFNIDCITPQYASLVKKGQMVVFKDSWEVAYVSADPTAGSPIITVGPDPAAGITGIGSAGLPSKAKHLPLSRVVFIQPAQMVRYRVQVLQLDPANANGLPCLVRDQGSYSSAGFAADPGIPQQIIAEGVQGFKVYLSGNSGQTWAGLVSDPATFPPGWDGWNNTATGIRGLLDTQLATAGRPNQTTTRGDEQWFRSIPTLVRVDLTTRTIAKRTEYATTEGTSAYRLLTQNMVYMPRHSGIPMN